MEDKINLILEYILIKHLYEFHSSSYSRKLASRKDGDENNELEKLADKSIDFENQLSKIILEINNTLNSEYEK